MPVLIPVRLEQFIISEFGAAGSQWVSRLPGHIAQLEIEWGFRAGLPYPRQGCASWVAPVELEDGSVAVLKVGMPHEEARFEAAALRFLDGDGAVRLLRESDDGFSLLLERCMQGTDLWSQSGEEAHSTACSILRKLWRETPDDAPFITLEDLTAQWWQGLPRPTDEQYDAAMVERAVALGRDLTASQTRRVFLHGDFHPGNVLAAAREQWLVIDPKPVIGDPAFDLAQWLHNQYPIASKSSMPVAYLRQQIELFADTLELEATRIAGWAFVKAFAWKWEPNVVALFEKVALG